MVKALSIVAPLSLLLYLHVIVDSELIEKCAPLADSPGCVCQLSGGLVNLTSLADTSGSPRFTNIAGPGGQTYSYNPCYGFTSSSECDQAAGCQNKLLSTGDISTETMYLFSGSEPAFLFYTNGTSGNQMQVRLHCNLSQEDPILLARGEINHQSLFVFDLYSKCVCPGVCETTVPSATPTTTPFPIVPSATPTTTASPVGVSDSWIVGIVLLSALAICMIAAVVVAMACFCCKKESSSYKPLKVSASSCDGDEMKSKLLDTPTT